MHLPLVILGAGPAGLACAQQSGVEQLIVDSAEHIGGLPRIVEESNGFLFQPIPPMRFEPDAVTLGEVERLPELEVSVYQGSTHHSCKFEIGHDGLPRGADPSGIASALLEKAGLHPRLSFARRVRNMLPRRHHGSPGTPGKLRGAFAPRQLEAVGTEDLKERSTFWLRTPLGTLDIESRQVTFPDRPTVHYQQLVSTIPLPELVARTVGVPQAIADATRVLRSSDCMVVNIGVAGRCTDRQIVYFPDPEVVFLRVVVASNFAPHFSPQGTTSLNVEVPSPSDTPIPRAGIIRRVLTDLIQVRLLRPSDRILHMSVFETPRAYPLENDVSRAAVEQIRSWYRERGVLTGGRGGLWQRLGIAAAIQSGHELAAEIVPAPPSGDDSTLGTAPYAAI